MFRLFLLALLILFFLWIVGSLFKIKTHDKNKSSFEKINNRNKSRFLQPNTILIIITGIILLALIVLLLPKFGINLWVLVQKLVLLISSLKGSLPLLK